MSKSTTPHFVHRRNRDGSYDSICSLCAVTTASATAEANLAEGERLHQCNRYILQARPKLMQPPPQRPSDQTSENT
jgi:hypothetical protein